MSALEQWAQTRQVTIAVMAAILEAGDRARSDVPHGDHRIEPAREYVARASELFTRADGES